MKTVYLLTIARYGQNSISTAYECQACANIQADWFRRDKCAAQVISVSLHEHIRGAVAVSCPALARAPVKLTQVEALHDHVPSLLGASKGY